MNIHYLEIVTPEAGEVCAQFAASMGLEFSEPQAALGGARTAALASGGMVGVRAPMHDQESPVTRSYARVDDIAAAVKAAADAGATVALPPMDIPGHGQCAIVIQGGIESGYWQV